METNYKITVPKPCHEDWNKMTPDETGRFCSSCVKSVVDFTNMKAPEIQEYFIQNQGKKVCGRFKTEQLDSIIIQIPRDVLFSQVKFHKMFMLALLISIPGIVSCQNSSGNRQKINKVEVVDSVKKEGMVEGKVKLKNPKQETVVMTPERKARIEELKKKREELVRIRTEQKKKKGYDSETVGKVACLVTGDVAVGPSTPLPEPPEGYVYSTAGIEVKPDFPGGIAKFYQYFEKNFKVPEDSKDVTGKIFLTFIVDTDGTLYDLKLLRGLKPSLDNEVLKFMKASPKWSPGEQNGKKVKVQYSMPIKFTAQ